MRVVVITPEQDRGDEAAVLDALFSAGLERCHLRKPHATAEELERWLERIPTRWRSRLVLHQHHPLVEKLGLGGWHWRDDGGAESAPQSVASPAGAPRGGTRPRRLTSRSCHDLRTLRAALGVFDAVFFGPVFPSLSKPGYAPKDAHIGEALGAILHTRTPAERRTEAIAIGGIDVATAPRAAALGFDGIAVLGAVWLAANPVEAYRRIQSAVEGWDARPARPAVAGLAIEEARRHPPDRTAPSRAPRAARTV